MTSKKMTTKQKTFCREYLVDLNATQAAIRAGYSPKRASEISYQLMKKTIVIALIDELKQEHNKQLGIDANMC